MPSFNYWSTLFLTTEILFGNVTKKIKLLVFSLAYVLKWIVTKWNSFYKHHINSYEALNAWTCEVASLKLRLQYVFSKGKGLHLLVFIEKSTQSWITFMSVKILTLIKMFVFCW